MLPGLRSDEGKPSVAGREFARNPDTHRFTDSPTDSHGIQTPTDSPIPPPIPRGIQTPTDSPIPPPIPRNPDTHRFTDSPTDSQGNPAIHRYVDGRIAGAAILGPERRSETLLADTSEVPATARVAKLNGSFRQLGAG
jgi:hypothetical protein